LVLGKLSSLKRRDRIARLYKLGSSGSFRPPGDENRA